MAYPSTAIANEFLRLAGEPPCVTQMQLQKLVYIAHGWNLAINGEPLASDAVKSWKYGPVFPFLYEHAKYFGASPIPRFITPLDNNGVAFFFDGAKDAPPYNAQFSDNERDVIRRVWERYGKYSAFKLSDMTHRPGTPWFETYFNDGPNNVIPNERIGNHYKELAARAN
jgi:uncharacterized phage-associated protein